MRKINYNNTTRALASETEKLIAAAEAGEHGTISRSGWGPVYKALRDWWSRRFDLEAFAPYLDVLDGETPEAATAALRALMSDEWRPAPSLVLRQLRELQEPEPEPPKERHGQRLRRDQRPDALAEVRRRFDAGAKVCDCPTRPFEVHIDALAVLTCTRCGGLEHGQVYESGREVP